VFPSGSKKSGSLTAYLSSATSTRSFGSCRGAIFNGRVNAPANKIIKVSRLGRRRLRFWFATTTMAKSSTDRPIELGKNAVEVPEKLKAPAADCKHSYFLTANG